MNPQELQAVNGILQLAATLTPVAVNFAKSLMEKVQGMSAEEIEALADKEYAALGKAADDELNKIGG